MTEILDLDALVPDSVMIKFGGEEIEVLPPKAVDVFKLGFLGQKMQDAGDMADGEMETTLANLTEHVRKCIPQLAGKELSTAQLLKLVEIISGMAVPPDTKELESRGITPDAPKKTGSDSSTK